MKRKDFLRALGFGTSALILPASIYSCEENSSSAGVIDKNFDPDFELLLKSDYKNINILDGQKTQVMSYSGEMLKGDPNALSLLEENYLGPIIKIKKGKKLRIKYKNELNDESIIHWHGLHVPEEADGHPRYLINNGEEYIYEFEINNRAGTYWFHPHLHGKTGLKFMVD